MTWAGNEILRNPNEPIAWDGCFWAAVPDSEDWFCWEIKKGGFCKRLPPHLVPDGLFVKLMEDALL